MSKSFVVTVSRDDVLSYIDTGLKNCEAKIADPDYGSKKWVRSLLMRLTIIKDAVEKATDVESYDLTTSDFSYLLGADCD